MELVIDNVEVVSSNSIEIEVPAEIEVVEGKKDYEVSVVKKEYTIIGDSIFIPSMYEDAPPWLKEFIDTTIDVAVNNRDQSLIDRMEAILTAMDYVPKNQYTEQINQIVSEDGIINSRIATLNSNLTDAISSTNATVAEINLTYASKDEAAAIAINALTASLSANGEIGSALKQLQEAYADLEGTTAQSISMLESVMEGEINGNAAAMETIRTYVGIYESGGSTGTGLLADVSILQKQNDGVIETVTGAYDVMVNPQDPNLAELVLTVEPYSSWKAQDVSGIDTRLAHIGDVYVKYADTPNGAKEYVASYKFIRTVVDSTSPYATDSDGFTWALIVDQVAQDAYEQALNAYYLADNKRRVFTITPSGPYDVGDLWVRGVSGSNQIWKCQATREQLGYYNATDWGIASTDDTATVALQTGLADGTVTVKLTNAYVGTIPFTTYIASEIDGKVGVYSGETAPVAGQPNGVAANDIYLWFTTASKVLANGTTQVYDITRTYKYSGSAWNEITTDSNITALADLADGKRTVFSGNTVPGGAVARDIWIPSATNGAYLQGEIYQYNGTAWVVATKYTEDLDTFIDVTYTPTVTSLQNQIDGKIESWYTLSTNDPKSAWTDDQTRAKHDGDMWYQTDTKLSYYYSSSTNSWNLIDDAKAIQALTNAATAQATADGVVVSFYAIKQDTAPATTSLWLNKTGTKVLKRYTTSWEDVEVKVGDTLTTYDPVTKDTSVYVYDGTGWITNTENGIVAGSEAITTLTANLATTNTTVGGHTTQLNTVDTRIANGVASVETKWAYNSTVNINGVYKKSGFGLTTNYTSGTGTEVDPYVSEFWIDASRLRFTNSNQTGRTSPFTIDATGTTPQIKFNGVVEFSNVTNVPQLGSTPQEVVNAVNSGNTTTINGDKITTGSITANNLNVAALSSITANIGSITSGYLQNEGNTNYINLNATGVQSFLKVNGNIDIKADGSGVFNRTLVSEPYVVASGQVRVTALTGTATVTVPTGIIDPNWLNSGGNQPYAVRFSLHGPVMITNSSPPYHIGYAVTGNILQHLGYTSNSSTSIAGWGSEYEIVIEITVKYIGTVNGTEYVSNGVGVNWALLRI